MPTRPAAQRIKFVESPEERPCGDDPGGPRPGHLVLEPGQVLPMLRREHSIVARVPPKTVEERGRCEHADDGYHEDQGTRSVNRPIPARTTGVLGMRIAPWTGEASAQPPHAHDPHPRNVLSRVAWEKGDGPAIPHATPPTANAIQR